MRSAMMLVLRSACGTSVKTSVWINCGVANMRRRSFPAINPAREKTGLYCGFRGPYAGRPLMTAAGAADCHAHVFCDNAYPFSPDTLYHPHASQAGTPAKFRAVLDAHDFTHGLL